MREAPVGRKRRGESPRRPERRGAAIHWVSRSATLVAGSSLVLARLHRQLGAVHAAVVVSRGQVSSSRQLLRALAERQF